DTHVPADPVEQRPDSPLGAVVRAGEELRGRQDQPTAVHGVVVELLAQPLEALLDPRLGGGVTGARRSEEPVKHQPPREKMPKPPLTACLFGERHVTRNVHPGRVGVLPGAALSPASVNPKPRSAIRGGTTPARSTGRVSCGGLVRRLAPPCRPAPN